MASEGAQQEQRDLRELEAARAEEQRCARLRRAAEIERLLELQRRDER